ncbi:hypothetical protein HDF26_002249 [Pedobacter cryoconitis]|uniref:Uncharacterized protein n=1 Tax=Pedobacter cryoconitis TaxID=188932 RepID=A0A7W8ZJ64_9SPHI|nr:hypothetical protein [Pedobacter cryoconitis]MBB5635024.1 hypothetical protein [Pedobacter cryoconitis]MBB6271792.1 hypothetical protein [Pedobacter cryoconitis]
MKKVLSILLLLIYTTASFGFSVKQFYCCGQLKSVSFTLKQDLNEKCSKGNEGGGCCKNQFHNLKVKDSHVASDEFGSPAKYFSDLHIPALITFYQGPSLAILEQISIANPTNAPPLHGGVPIYIFNCIYRI